MFPGSLQVSSLDEAEAVLRRQLGPDTAIEHYLSILSALIQAEDDEGLSTDDLMLATGLESHKLQSMLRELDRLRLLSNDTEIGVTLYKDPDTIERLEALCKLEDALLANLRETAPDADQEGWQILNVRRLCDTLRRDTQLAFDPEKLSRLLKSFAEAFGDNPGQRGFFALRPAGMDNRLIKLLRNWQEIDAIRQRRMRLAKALVSQFLNRRQSNNLLVTCRQGDLESSLQTDMTLQDLDIRDWSIALATSLIYLDTNDVLHLSRGKAVFRSAMSIALNAEARRRQFKKSDYAELDLHYKDKIVQVHVMAEYARLALGKVRATMRFIDDYFSLDRNDFVRQYFASRKEVLEMATTEASHRRILTDLQNPEQQAIVATSIEGNHLVLAGPGSGKTRVIVHRVAWLLRECMVLPDEIMVLAFNHSAAVEIRRRLWALVGPDAGGVVVQTLHGLAMRLTGTSFAVAAERGEKPEFDTVIKDATTRLRQTEQGDEIGPSVQRDRALSGLRFLLVDEYQDINGDHYELISALAGRTLNSEEDKLSLMVVGDDDQNIYAFDGASVRYIRQFEADYKARRYHLVENYRSTSHIIDCANQVIASARERMKMDQAIRINHARRDQPAGGDYARIDPVANGRVHVLEVPENPNIAAQMALAELERLNGLSGSSAEWGRFAAIARRWDDLEPLAALCRLRGVPARQLRDTYTPDLHDTREGDRLLSLLREEFRQARRSRVLLRSGTLSRWFRRRYGSAVDSLIEHPQRAVLARFIVECESSAPGSEQVVQNLIESIYEYGSGDRSVLGGQPNGPLVLMTAHRAKGLEFDHVLILDGGGWSGAGDDERRLFYVAMTRARKTLTLCESAGGRHAFLRDLGQLPLRSRPSGFQADCRLAHRTWMADPSQVFLSWPGYFAVTASVHKAIATLEVGSSLKLRPCTNGKPGWEAADLNGIAVIRMAQDFKPLPGIIEVRVSAIQVRKAKKGDDGNLRCRRWELVLPEIEYLP